MEHLVAYWLAGGVRLFSRLQVRRGFHLTPLGHEIFVRIGAEGRLNCTQKARLGQTDLRVVVKA